MCRRSLDVCSRIIASDSFETVSPTTLRNRAILIVLMVVVFVCDTTRSEPEIQEREQDDEVEDVLHLEYCVPGKSCVCVLVRGHDDEGVAFLSLWCVEGRVGPLLE